LQYRTLNTRKGPAVQAHRLQCDKEAFPARIQAVIDQTNHLRVIESHVSALWLENGSLRGIALEDGTKLRGKTVVLATGTFLSGRIHIGKVNWEGGRIGEKGAYTLSESIRSLGLRMGRLKTGTPPRLHKDSLDYDKMERQPGLEPAPFLSHAAREERRMFHVEHSARNQDLASMFHVEQITPATHPWTPATNKCRAGFHTPPNKRTTSFVRISATAPCMAA
jgi:glucose-inhibited division protein A